MYELLDELLVVMGLGLHLSTKNAPRIARGIF